MQSARSSYRPRFELLEERAQPSVFVVTNPYDVVLPSGQALPGSFRWAIQQANQHPNDYYGWDQIHFQLPGRPFVITQQQPLDPVTEPVIVDGSTQPGLDPNLESIYIYLPKPLDPGSNENTWRINVWIGVPEFGDNVIVKFNPRPVPPPPVIIVDPLDPKLLHKPELPPGGPERAVLDEVFALPEKTDFLIQAAPKLSRPFRVGHSDQSLFLPGDQTRTGKIMGTLFEDFDGDGVRGPDEPAVADRVVYLDLNHNGKLDDGEPTAITNDKGEYRFEYLRPGNYLIEQVLWPHLVQTLPKDGGNQVELSAGQTIMDVDFGAVKVQKRRVPVSISDGDSRLPMDREDTFRPAAALFVLGGLIQAARQRGDEEDA